MFISGKISYHLSFLAYPEFGQVISHGDVDVKIYTVNGEEDNLICSDVTEESTFDRRRVV